jgi:hypothetical protein
MSALLVSGVVAPVIAFVANGVSAATYLPPPTHADSCGYPVSSSAYANYHPTTKTSQGSYGSAIPMPEPSVIQALHVYGTGLTAHVGLFANDESGLLLGVQTKSSAAVPTAWQAVSQTTLTGTGLAKNTQYTTLSVAALPTAYASGDSLTLISGFLELSHITVAQPAAQGATTITVDAFNTGHIAFPAGTIVIDTASPYGQATNPNIGDPGATEATLGGPSSRLDYPALYITNLTQSNGTLLTSNMPAYYAGDWQQGGTGTNFVNAIYGDWTTDNATGFFGVPTFSLVPNNWDLGPNADTPPFNPATQFNQGYGSEVVWNASAFASMAIANQGSTTGLIPGDTYRIEAIAPEVDPGQRGTGGAESCTTLVVPGPPTMHTTTTATDPNNAEDTATSSTDSGLTAPVGFAISDTATLTPISGFGNPTGTVTFNLYKNDTSCTSTPVFTDTESVSSGSPFTATSLAYTASTLATYYWQDTFTSTNPNYASTTGPCGNEYVQTSDARITLSPETATNATGNADSVAATLQSMLPGGSWTTLSDSNATITFTLSTPSGGGYFTDASNDNLGTSTTCTTASGSCTVMVTDPKPETTTVHATSTFGASAEGVSGLFTRSTDETTSDCSGLTTGTCDATKTWAQGGITLTPETTSNNPLGGDVTETAQLQYTTDGSTYTDITDSGATIDLTLPSPSGSAYFTDASNDNLGTSTTCTTTSGSCSVIVTDPAAETVTVHASAPSFSAANEGISGTLSASTGTPPSCSTSTGNCDASITTVPGQICPGQTINAIPTGTASLGTGPVSVSLTYPSSSEEGCVNYTQFTANANDLETFSVNGSPVTTHRSVVFDKSPDSPTIPFTVSIDWGDLPECEPSAGSGLPPCPTTYDMTDGTAFEPQTFCAQASATDPLCTTSKNFSYVTVDGTTYTDVTETWSGLTDWQLRDGG